MPEIPAECLLESDTVTIRDVRCRGHQAHQGDEESTTATHLVFPYRGVFVRHLGSDQAVAEANQVLFFNHTESYRVSHPVPGGDASLDLVISAAVLRDLAPKLPALEVQAGRVAALNSQLKILEAALVSRVLYCVRSNVNVFSGEQAAAGNRGN